MHVLAHAPSCFWGDNLGIMLGISKGRFQQPHLLMLMRSAAFHILSASLLLYGRWIPSELNEHADRRSRLRDPPATSKRAAPAERTRKEETARALAQIGGQANPAASSQAANSVGTCAASDEHISSHIAPDGGYRARGPR